MNRYLNVMRMQLINRLTYVWIPMLVMGGSFLISLAIFAILAFSGIDRVVIGGGLQAPLWYFLVVGVQSLTLAFPFSQAMSVTRREFFIGTLLTAAASAAIQALVVVVGGLLEQATDGFGTGGYFFALPWVWEAGPVGAGIVYFSAAMLMFAIGFASATVFKRFGSLGLTTVLLGFGVLVVLIVWAITASQSWPNVWAGLIALGAIGLAGWGLLGATALAASSFATLRRAVP